MFVSILVAVLQGLSLWNNIGPLSMGEKVSDVFRTLGPAPLVRDCNGGCHYKAAYTDGTDLLAVSFVPSLTQEIWENPKKFDNLILQTIGLFRGHHTCLAVNPFGSVPPELYFPWIIAPDIHPARMKYHPNIASWTWMGKTGFQGITKSIHIPHFHLYYRGYGDSYSHTCGVADYHGTPQQGLAQRIVVYVEHHDVAIDSVEESINTVEPLDSKTIDEEGMYYP